MGLFDWFGSEEEVEEFDCYESLYNEIHAKMEEIDKACDEFWEGVSQCDTKEEEYEYCKSTF